MVPDVDVSIVDGFQVPKIGVVFEDDDGKTSGVAFIQ